MTLTLHNDINNTNNNNDNCKFYDVHINKEAFAETACEDNYLLINLHQEVYIRHGVKKRKCRQTTWLIRSYPCVYSVQSPLFICSFLRKWSTK